MAGGNGYANNDANPRIESKSIRIADRVQFGRNVSIAADSIEIGDSVKFGDDVRISCRGALRIGHHSIIGRAMAVNCNNLTIGSWLFSCEGVEVGAGGCRNKEANLVIGDGVGIFERVLINTNSPVTIGDDCGIGREVQIWTHGAWLDPLEGFPSDFGPVTIGKNVWLPARSILLANSSIGDNCVIGINSVINKSIPAGSFAAGSPARVIRANAYPAPLDAASKAELLRTIVSDWEEQITYRAPELKYSVEVRDSVAIHLFVNGEYSVFDCVAKTVEGATNRYSEDLRDYLRRRGVKIYTDNFFTSI